MNRLSPCQVHATNRTVYKYNTTLQCIALVLFVVEKLSQLLHKLSLTAEAVSSQTCTIIQICTIIYNYIYTSIHWPKTISELQKLRVSILDLQTG